MFYSTLNKGFQLDLPNGWTVSVQWGPGNYCERGRASFLNFDALMKVDGAWKSSTAEVAAWVTDKRDTIPWYKFGSDSGHTDVAGYYTVSDVVQFINAINNLPKEE